MSGVHGQVLGHLMRRGYNAAQSHFAAQQPTPEYVARLQHDAELYDQSGPEMEVQPWQILPMLITGLLVMLVVISIRYTLGEVMASLTMIESPTATAIVDDKPPPYADEPDAPLEKESLLPAEAQADVEVTLVKNIPVTASIRATMMHLRQVGGFRAKWRGLPLSIIYHLVHSIITNCTASLLGMGMMGRAVMYIVTSMAFCHLHMAWTHSMIAYPTSTPFYKRMGSRDNRSKLYLPSFVFAAAQQATYIIPMIVAVAVGIPEVQHKDVMDAASHHGCSKMLGLGLRFLAVPLSALFVAFAILLPATVTLTRIEALLLPENEDTIVPFDRQALVAGINLNARGSSKKLFVAAWRSFDRAARWRLIKLYIKMVFIQISVVFVGAHLVVAELFLVGGEKLGLLFKSGAAQLQLMALEAPQTAQ